MKLLDLINPTFLQRVQTLFSSYLGTSLMITDIHGTPLIPPIAGVRMCSLIRNTPQGEIICESSDRRGGHETLLSKQTHVYRCQAGFIDFSAAILFRDEVIGLLVGGQAKTGEEDPRQMLKISAETGVPVKDLESAYDHMPSVSEEELEERLSFIKRMMEYICSLTYIYYEEHQKDMKLIADADARVRAAEDMTELFDRHLKRMSDAVNSGGNADGETARLRDELEDMLRHAGSVREAISVSPEYQGCADKDYRIREVTYELQWVLMRVGATYGERVHVPHDVAKDVPPYLCGDPAAISEVLSRVILFMTKKYPDIRLEVSVSVEQDQYAALLRIRILSPDLVLPDKDMSRIINALEGNWECLLEDGELDYLELTTASSVVQKLSAELKCQNTGSEGFYFELTVPQLPAKGGFY